MDFFSIIIFLIYVILILMVLVFVSPAISAFLLILVPVVSVFLLPDQAIQFFSIQQFSFGGLYIQNIHVLLSIWSALIGIAAYSEILSWYLLREEKPAPKKVKPEIKEVKPIPKEPEKATAVTAQKPGEPPKSMKNKVEDFLVGLGKIMSGTK